MFLNAIARACLWWALDMADPEFVHDKDDAQAQIAEMAVERASRPQRSEIIAFHDALLELLYDLDNWNKATLITLRTEYEPTGLLSEAIRKSGRTPNVHHLSWFTSMRISRGGSVWIKRSTRGKQMGYSMILEGVDSVKPSGGEQD